MFLTNSLVIPYYPRPWQIQIHEVEARFKVLVVPRGHGKSVACVNEIIRSAFTTNKPNLRYAYVAVSYRAAKRIVWDYFKQFLVNIPGVTFNEADLSIKLPNKAEILLLGAEAADNLRGIHLNGVVMDEVALMPHAVWHEVVRPMLSDKKGWAIFIGTPNGQNLFYDLYEQAKVTQDWYAFKSTIWELGVFPADEIEAIKSSMTEEAFAQELECSFSAAAQGTFYAPMLERALEEGRIGLDIRHNPKQLVYTSWDLGWNDKTCIWFFQVYGGKRYYIDYYENSRQPLFHYANVVKAKCAEFEYDYHIVPHDAEQHEQTTGEKRIDTLSAHGLNVVVAPRVKKVIDRINATQIELANCLFNKEKCAAGLHALREYKADFNDRRGVFSTEPLHDWSSHAADAFGYGITGMKKSTLRPYNKYKDSQNSRTEMDYGPSIKFW